jgi:hypothetical protein
MPDRIARSVLQKAEPLYADETVGSAVRLWARRAHLTDLDGRQTGQACLFLHHRVQVIPVSTQGRIDAVVCLEDFFRALAEHFASARPESGSRHRSCAYTADTTCSSVASVRPS